MPQLVTADRLRAALLYDPLSGIFTWRIKPNRRIRIGSKAGTLTRGRIHIRLDGQIHRAHRLAWLYVNGHWPKREIDHRNGNASDNRIDNLRDVTHAVNTQNQRRPHSRNITGGLLGVSTTRSGKQYRARIDNRHLGVFETPERAHQAYIAAKRNHHEGGML